MSKETHQTSVLNAVKKTQHRAESRTCIRVCFSPERQVVKASGYLDTCTTDFSISQVNITKSLQSNQINELNPLGRSATDAAVC